MTAPDAVLLMTRPVAASRQFLSELEQSVAARLDVCLAPLIRIVPLSDQLSSGGARGLLFSSANAVRVAAARLPGRELPCYCVGRATTEAACSAGWRAQMLGQDADELVATMLAAPVPAPLVHLHGVHTRGNVAGRLSAAGLQTSGQAIYDQHLDPLTQDAVSRLSGSLPVLAPVFSPRTARHLSSMLTGNAPVHVFALSRAVADAMADSRVSSINVAPEPNAPSLRQELENFVNRSSWLEGSKGAQ